MNKLLDKVKQFVDESFKYDEAQIRHFDRTVYWLQQLKPEADEALLIAAYAHDTERAFRLPEKSHEITGKSFLDPESLKQHQEKGAKIIGDFLEKNGAGRETIDKVKHLISAHEIGGGEDQNFLKDADSLSFLENNGSIFMSRLEKLGYDRVKEKFDWMYERITSQSAKEVAKPLYEKMVSDLDSAK